MAFGDIIQSLEYNEKLTSLTLDWTDGSTPTEGNLIIIVAGTRGNATFSTPSGYTEALADEPWSGSSSTNTYIWYKIASASESNVNVNDGNGAASIYIGAVEVEGPWHASILEYAGSAEGTVAKTTGLAPGTTGTLSQADCFALATLFYRGTSSTIQAPTAVAASGFTEQGVFSQGAATYCLSDGYLYKVTSATTALNPTITWSMTSSSSLLTKAQIVVFKKSDGGGGGLPIPVAMRYYRNMRT